MASYLINGIPTRILKFQTPLQFLKYFPQTKIIHYLPLKVFGCIAFVLVQRQNHSKLNPRFVKCVFLGYSPTQKGYKCYDLISKKSFVSMDVTFFENKPYLSKILFKGRQLWEEDSFWEISGSLPMPILNSNLGGETLLESSMPILNSNSGEETLLGQPCIKLHVYLRRKRDQGVENQPLITHQASHPSVCTLEEIGIPTTISSICYSSF